MSAIDDVLALREEWEELQDEYESLWSDFEDKARVRCKVISKRQQEIIKTITRIVREAQEKPVLEPGSSEYPEHEKLRAIQEQSQTIGHFLEWLAVEKDVMLCKADPEYTGDRSPFWPIRKSREKLLADYFGIDLKKIEQEKQAMLDKLRAQPPPKESDASP